MLAVALTVCVLTAYAASLWWLLRREAPVVLVGLLTICLAALSLRLVYTTDFPAGMNEDETKVVARATEMLRDGRLFENGVEGPVLLNALFQAQLIPWLGPSRWTVRTYSMLTNVLSLAVAFAVGRGLGLRVVPSLGISALLAVLPWSLFYGRISLGGELTFHQLLLLAALARLVFADGGWPEVAIGGLGMGLLLYDYQCGRAMLATPFVAAVLARGRRRWLCLAVLAVALLGWLPYLTRFPSRPFVAAAHKLHPDYGEKPLATLATKTFTTLQSLVQPVAWDYWMSVRAAAMHPVLILGLALIGACNGLRRSVFLWAGFVAGLIPAVLSIGTMNPSTHRMLMAFPFIALAAGVALDWVRWPALRVGGTIAAALVAGVYGVRLYFSPNFWFSTSRELFLPERTAVLESVPYPAPARFIVDRNVTYSGTWRALVDPRYELLTLENWFPPSDDASIYAFTERATALQPFYADLVGANRVRSFGRAFVVTLDKNDWSWIRQHGWTYEARCGTTIRRAPVPVLFQAFLTFDRFNCPTPVTHVWYGRWNGAATRLRVRFTGHVTIDTPRGRVLERDGFEASADFDVDTDAPLTVTLVTRDPPPSIALLQVLPAAERVPAWEAVTPIVPPA